MEKLIFSNTGECYRATLLNKGFFMVYKYFLRIFTANFTLQVSEQLFL